jgi:hypothetical protein
MHSLANTHVAKVFIKLIMDIANLQTFASDSPPISHSLPKKIAFAFAQSSTGVYIY